MGRVIQILVASSPSAAMEERQNARAVPGRGLEGDRYFDGIGTFSPHPMKPAYELTLIEQEKIEEFSLQSGLPFTSHHARRNVVTQGIDLNALVGRLFAIGEVTARGIKLCEPCDYLARITFPQVLKGLVHKAGLRAQIVSGGVVRVGDPISDSGGDHQA